MQRPIPYVKLIIVAGILVLLGAGFLVAQKALKGREPPGAPAAPKKERLTIFLPRGDGHLVQKTVETKEGVTEREKVDVIMRELRMGNAVPDALTLREFSIDSEGVLYLNLSRDLLDEKTGGADEITTVYGITNSFLANFREAKKVQILVEGQAVHTIHGVLYTYAPIEFNNQLWEEYK
jgi:hypothetical protein